MNTLSAWKRPALALVALSLAVSAAPAPAQKASSAQADAEARIKKLEAEVKALQRQVFPGGDGKYFPPEINKPAGAAPSTGTPATTPVTDLLTRMDAVESQLSRITAQNEENANRLAQLEAKLGAGAVPATTTSAAPAATKPAATTAAVAPAVTTSAPAAPAATSPAATTPAATTTFPTPAPVTLTPAKPATTTATKPESTTPAAKPVAPSAQRVAAVKAVEKPSTADAGDDEYSYGYRLWEAKFYPEAEQQLQLFLTKYPRHQRISYARNLMGRAYLDEDKPREAAQWFLKNYQADKTGARAPDSLLYLAESMRQLKDTSRACIALAEFGETFASEASGRLKTQYEATRRGVKCN
ncbi:MAG: tetratricopeptide repeat protein [Novosphingobium sp.]